MTEPCPTGGGFHVLAVVSRDAKAPKAEGEPLLTPAEAAGKFNVSPKTVTRWAREGRLSTIRTLGGHRRYRESEVEALVAANTEPAGDAA